MAGPGLYANIHAKRKRGGKMRKKGAKGAPTAATNRSRPAGGGQVSETIEPDVMVGRGSRFNREPRLGFRLSLRRFGRRD